MSFVTDFDGTITDDDFFVYVKEAFLDDTALAPWNRYLAGEITHFDALKQMFGSIRVNEEELINLIKKVNVDKWVIPTFEMLHKAQIPIYIASAGCDYYIKLLIGHEIEKYGVTLVTNRSSYSQLSGLMIERLPKDSPFYNEEIGISKAGIVNHLLQGGKRVVFAGDGPPDFEPAKLADTVFAKKILLEKCEKEGLKTKKFNDYQDIYTFFESELAK